MEVQSETSFTKQGMLHSQSKVGLGPFAPPVSSYIEAYYITETHETKQNYFVSQSHTGQGTLVPSSSYNVNPILIQGSMIQNTPPFWSYSVPPPGLQHNVGSTVPAAAVFYPGSNIETSNIPLIPVQWNTPVVMPSHAPSEQLCHIINPTMSHSKFPSPQSSRFPSSQGSPRSNEEQNNMPFKRVISPSFQRNSSNNKSNDQSLNKTGSGH
ncbi:unnamed protein product [Mytilus coruscus]|uniref:Uncharacterized protein n=1 Tax=Mytilus coruscus TaxID=42192 RepID=A0A6J8CPI2_MYTCO|nr:unnamed protein product [Mytilus coruscus]